jgi:hypothetical protein
MARRTHFIDLARYHERFGHGDLTVFLTWCGDALSPCLVIVPAFIEGHERVTPCVVPQRVAWVWSEAIGDGRHCALTSYLFCEQLRLNPSINNCMRVTSIIREHIGDLLAMPPATSLHFERAVVADAIRTDQDGKEHHSEVSDHV